MTIEIKTIHKLTFRDKEIELTLDEVIALRDATLKVAPIKPDIPQDKIRIPKIKYDSNKWVLDNDAYHKGTSKVSTRILRQVLQTMNNGVDYRIDELSKLTNLSYSHMFRIMEILEMENKVTLSWERNVKRYRLKQISYTPKPQDEKIVTITNPYDLSALNKAYKDEREIKKDQ